MRTNNGINPNMLRKIISDACEKLGLERNVLNFKSSKSVLNIWNSLEQWS